MTTGAHRRTGTTSVQQTFRLKALHKHSGFTMQNLKHDIAVLQLERNAQLSDKVTTVCLPDQAADLNSKCYITGLTLPLMKTAIAPLRQNQNNHASAFYSLLNTPQCCMIP